MNKRAFGMTIATLLVLGVAGGIGLKLFTEGKSVRPGRPLPPPPPASGQITPLPSGGANTPPAKQPPLGGGSVSPPPPAVVPPAGQACGNGMCSSGETTLSCAKDCPLSIAPKELWMHPNHWNDTWVSSETLWPTVANSIDTFGVFWIQVNNSKAASFALPLMQQKGIRVNVEVGGLRPFQCDGTTFFNAIDAPVFDKLVKGGHSNFIASMDAPFTYTANDGFHSQCATLWKQGKTSEFSAAGCDPNTTLSCGLSMSQVADEVVEYLALFSARYPNASIGWVEPLPLLRFGSFASDTGPIPGTPFPDFKVAVDLLTEKIQAYNATHNPDIKLRFFHSDWYFTGMYAPTINGLYDAWAKHLAISNYVRGKGLRFGILMNDYRETLPTKDAKNKLFHDNTLAYYDCWHAKGGTLDDIVVESWVSDHPLEEVPETKANTFTNVVLGLIERLVNPNYSPTCNDQKYISEIVNMPQGPATTFGER
jgi:hypothetical protein